MQSSSQWHSRFWCRCHVPSDTEMQVSLKAPCLLKTHWLVPGLLKVYSPLQRLVRHLMLVLFSSCVTKQKPLCYDILLGTEALMSSVLQQLLQGRCLKSSRQWFPGYRTPIVLVLSAILKPWDGISGCMFAGLSLCLLLLLPHLSFL